MSEQIDLALRSALATDGTVSDTLAFAASLGVPHDQVVPVVKSFERTEQVVSEVIASTATLVTQAGQEVVDGMSPEISVVTFVLENGGECTNESVQAHPAAKGDGYRVCMKNGWLKAEKRGDLPPPQESEQGQGEDGGDGAGDKKKKQKKQKDTRPVFVVAKVSEVPADDAKNALAAVAEKGPEAVPAQVLKDLKKRKFVAEKTIKSFRLTPGPNFTAEKKELVADLTADMLKTGEWKNASFKPYNFHAMGRLGAVGHLHPLMKVRAAYRQVFLEMGYEEMPTDNFVESSFWNFDSLFQPQQHPARDSHDTFFVADSPPLSAPEDYVQRVSDMHSKGGDGSIGWKYDWSREEARKTIMRTHTTAVSSRMLYKLAKEGFQPRKYFSIDRVFRNETPDATHLAEFHQIEGVVCDRNLSLADLIGTTKAFFERIGITGVRFKPAYNPYTEPSMEIFAYHPELKKWTEVGNSGIFRPEMLRPMGLPEDVSCIAWGISLERPTMIRYGIPNIRALIGSKVDLGFVRGAPVFRL